MQNKIGIIAYCKEIISFAGVYYHNTLKYNRILKTIN